MKPGEESKSATVPRLGLKSMILGSDALDQLIITTSQCVARTVPRLSSFPELKVKLASLSEILTECYSAKAVNSKLYAIFESDIRHTCGRVQDTCQKYAKAKFKTFCKENINKELSQHIQHVSHIINSMALFSYMCSGQSRKESFAEPPAENTQLQSAMSTLREKVESLTRQLTAMQEGKSVRSRTQRSVAENKENELRNADASLSNGSSVSQERAPKRRQSMPTSEAAGCGATPAEQLCLKGDCVFHGHGMTQDYEKALEFYTQAAQQGSGRACACLARMYENGVGVERNLPEAFNWYKQGGECGDSGCLFALGKFHEKKQVPDHEPDRGIEDAVSYYERAASENNQEALTKLGHMYEHGIYYSKDPEKALEYYKKAANLGDPLAINYVGLGYYRDQKYKQAVECFKKSKEQGCARGANNLGMCYEQGLGVEQDLEQALKCYKESAEKKYPQAMFSLGYLYLRRAKTTESVEQFETAAYWFRGAIAEDQSMPEPYFYLAFLFEKGIGVNYDFQTAYNYYKQAADLGYPNAFKKCGDMLYSGHELLQANKAEAMKYYQKAAEHNDADAYNALGLMHEKGFDGHEPDLDLAVQNFEKGYQLGCLDAGTNLAFILLDEKGEKFSQTRGMQVMREVAQKGDVRAKEYLVEKEDLMLPEAQTIANQKAVPAAQEDKSLKAQDINVELEKRDALTRGNSSPKTSCVPESISEEAGEDENENVAAPHLAEVQV